RQAHQPVRIDVDVTGGAGQAAAAIAGDPVDVVAHGGTHQALEARHLHFLLAVVVENEYCLGHRRFPRVKMFLTNPQLSQMARPPAPEPLPSARPWRRCAVARLSRWWYFAAWGG